jgi:hypothetical protein
MNDNVIAALSYPCRGGTNIKIALCNGNNFKWQFLKFAEGSSDSSCITNQATNTACDVNSTMYTGICSGAASDTCPSTLQALINAWILSLRSSQK